MFLTFKVPLSVVVAIVLAAVLLGIYAGLSFYNILKPVADALGFLAAVLAGAASAFLYSIKKSKK